MTHGDPLGGAPRSPPAAPSAAPRSRTARSQRGQAAALLAKVAEPSPLPRGRPGGSFPSARLQTPTAQSRGCPAAANPCSGGAPPAVPPARAREERPPHAAGLSSANTAGNTRVAGRVLGPVNFPAANPQIPAEPPPLAPVPAPFPGSSALLCSKSTPFPNTEKILFFFSSRKSDSFSRENNNIIIIKLIHALAGEALGWLRGGGAGAASAPLRGLLDLPPAGLPVSTPVFPPAQLASLPSGSPAPRALAIASLTGFSRGTEFAVLAAWVMPPQIQVCTYNKTKAGASRQAGLFALPRAMSPRSRRTPYPA